MVPRVLLLLPTETYRAKDFLGAAERLGVDVVVGSARRQALADAMGDRAVVVPLSNPDGAVKVIAALHDRLHLDAVLAVDDQSLVVAATASAHLGLAHNPVDAVAATRDKAVMRARLAAGAVAQPRYQVVSAGHRVAAAASRIGYPCVVKPVSRSGSQGVIRVGDDVQAVAAAKRVRAIVGPVEPILIEGFVAGAEVAVEGLLVAGSSRCWPSSTSLTRLTAPSSKRRSMSRPAVSRRWSRPRWLPRWRRRPHRWGCGEGPVHAELRVGADSRPVVIEMAARSIGLCSRALRFGAGVSLEEVIVRHAVGAGLDGLRREAQASGVIMLPIRAAGLLEKVSGQAEALAVDGVAGLEISIPAGRAVVPLPEGDRYLGFVFARGPTPEEVEHALRRAEAALDVVVRPAYRWRYR